MNKFEQLREELTKIKQEAAQREAAKKVALLENEKRIATEQAKELETQKIIKENWKVVKEQTLRVFQEINNKVLASKGTIAGWRKEKARHYHYRMESSGGYDDQPITSSAGYALCQDHTEVADLTIKGVGKLFVFRILQNKMSSCGGYPFNEIPLGELGKKISRATHALEIDYPELLMLRPWRVHIGFSTDERLNPCYNCGSFVLNPLESLTPTSIQEEIEKSVVLQLQPLYQARYSSK